MKINMAGSAFGRRMCRSCFSLFFSLMCLFQANDVASSPVDDEKMLCSFFPQGQLKQYKEKFFEDNQFNGKFFLGLLENEDVEIKHAVLNALQWSRLRELAGPKQWDAIRLAVIGLLKDKDKDLKLSAMLCAKYFWRDDNDHHFAKALANHLREKDEWTVVCAIKGLWAFHEYVHGSEKIIDDLKVLAVDESRSLVQLEATKLLIEFVEPQRTKN